MGNFLGGMLALLFLGWLFVSAAYGTVYGIVAAIHVRDCSLVTGEKCRWHLLPDSAVDERVWRP
jgi:predicted lipid-binding transport protein (Tim44 family)